MKNPEERVLGKKVKNPKLLKTSVIVAVPRILNREIYSINNSKLPFNGFDVWHAYEFSFMLSNGFPVAGILKIIYSAISTNIVESKSLKLYLNSFNMTTFEGDIDFAIETAREKIRQDLSDLIGSDVSVNFFAFNNKIKDFDFHDYAVLEKYGQIQEIKTNIYKEDSSILEMGKGGKIKVCSHLLRSNCKVTFQPDWGNIFIEMSGKELHTELSLLKYIISLRNENHFHDEKYELIYKRLQDKFSPDNMMICCLYTRRGGIDICPVRYSENYDCNFSLIDPKILTQGSFRQ